MLVVCGAVVALTLFRICGDRRRLLLKQTWSAALLDALGIEVEADLTHAVPGALLVANHISWIDIFVINAVMPSAFVSKEEVRHWPISGWLAATRPDILFVAYGHPRQDAWIAAHRHELSAAVAIGVGGAFDFVAGVQRRAPAWLQRLNLEWLYRLLREPRRWRRMLKLPVFVGMVLAESGSE